MVEDVEVFFLSFKYGLKQRIYCIRFLVVLGYILFREKEVDQKKGSKKKKKKADLKEVFWVRK